MRRIDIGQHADPHRVSALCATMILAWLESPVKVKRDTAKGGVDLRGCPETLLWRPLGCHCRDGRLVAPAREVTACLNRLLSRTSPNVPTGKPGPVAVPES